MDKLLQNNSFRITMMSVFGLKGDDAILWIEDDDSIRRLREEDGKYDYAVVSDYFETVDDPLQLLCVVKACLKVTGKLLLALNNPLGLRYFVGDKDPYTGRNFDSIESYMRVNKYDRNNLPGRIYDRAQTEEFLDDAGFGKRILYSAFPNLEFLQLVYREDILPNEDISSRILPLYNSPDTLFLDEFTLQQKLQKNGMFHQFANAYIFECHVSEDMNTPVADSEKIKHATINLNRGPECAMVTRIMESGEVVKCAIFPEGKKMIRALKDNHDELRRRGVNAVDVVINNDSASSKFIEGVGGIEYFQKLAGKIRRSESSKTIGADMNADGSENSVDIDFLIKKVDEFRDIILKSSDRLIEEGTGEILLAKGYIDLTLINCIYENDEPVFFDQEYVIERLPAKVLIMRLVDYVYFGNATLEAILPRTFFEERYGLSKGADRWHRELWQFMSMLKHEEEQRPFFERHCANPDIINVNRQRMNYSPAEYKALFYDIFAGLENKDLYVFGSGRFAEKFVNLYGRFYDAKALVDNDETKWGTKKYGKTIISPAELNSLDVTSYKVIICIKNYSAVLKQLQAAGVKSISVFEPSGVYEVRRKSYKSEDNITANDIEAPGLSDDEDKRKPYNIGYVAGVFDLFHIGHLNLLRRAKEQCNHLIVGVVNDEAVQKNKKTTPFVPFEERIEMVRACRYVDEAVEITYENSGTREAFRYYHFDAQFSGSDYVNSGSWLAEKEFLEKNGAELVFFPYTEQTSSTKIKKLIEEKLV